MSIKCFSVMEPREREREREVIIVEMSLVADIETAARADGNHGALFIQDLDLKVFTDNVHVIFSIGSVSDFARIMEMGIKCPCQKKTRKRGDRAQRTLHDDVEMAETALCGLGKREWYL